MNTGLSIAQDAAATNAVGPQHGWYHVTPDEAQRVLERQNVGNRKISNSQVARHARDMANGNWITNGDSLRFAHDGTLLDGQHRLSAVVKSGATVQFLVVWNLPHEAQATMDDGRKRTMKDTLDFQGRTQHSKTVASILRRGIAWEQGHRGNLGSGNSSPTKLEMSAFYDGHPDVLHSAEVADRVRSSRTVKASQSTIGIAHWIFAQVDRADADEFFARLADGAGLPPSSPILTLRNKLIALGSTVQKTEFSETLAWFIKAWNAWRANRDLKLIRHKATDSFPEPR